MLEAEELLVPANAKRLAALRKALLPKLSLASGVANDTPRQRPQVCEQPGCVCT